MSVSHKNGPESTNDIVPAYVDLQNSCKKRKKQKDVLVLLCRESYSRFGDIQKVRLALLTCLNWHYTDIKGMNVHISSAVHHCLRQTASSDELLLCHASAAVSGLFDGRAEPTLTFHLIKQYLNPTCETSICVALLLSPQNL